MPGRAGPVGHDGRARGAVGADAAGSAEAPAAAHRVRAEGANTMLLLQFSQVFLSHKNQSS